MGNLIAEVQGTIIKDIFCGNKNKIKSEFKLIEYDENCTVTPGKDIREYNVNGLIWTEKTLQEKYEAGLVELPQDQKVENNEVVEKTIDEQFQDGSISLEDYNSMKLVKLREIRNNLLFMTVTAIQQQYQCEQDDLALNGNSSGKITEEKYKEWLVYWRDLRDLPEIIKIEDFTYENIETAFPVQPN